MKKINGIEKFLKTVLDCSFKVYPLVPGLLESAYEKCFFYEIKKTGLQDEKQKALPLVYEEV